MYQASQHSAGPEQRGNERGAEQRFQENSEG